MTNPLESVIRTWAIGLLPPVTVTAIGVAWSWLIVMGDAQTSHAP